MKKKEIAALLSVVAAASQIFGYGSLTSCAAEYEGVTQITTKDQFLELSRSGLNLVVEEVYVEASGYVQEGAEVLKLTDDSYQDALDYYEAAIIYAENNLTNTQMEYDKGMQEAEYQYEIAKAAADQAEFERDQSQSELDSTIE
jgi:hypothetical protein